MPGGGAGRAASNGSAGKSLTQLLAAGWECCGGLCTTLRWCSVSQPWLLDPNSSEQFMKHRNCVSVLCISSPQGEKCVFESLVLIGHCCWLLACTEPQSVPGICLCVRIKRDEPTSYASFRKIGLPFLSLGGFFFFLCLCVYMWEGIAVIFIYYTQLKHQSKIWFPFACLVLITAWTHLFSLRG